MPEARALSICSASVYLRMICQFFLYLWVMTPFWKLFKSKKSSPGLLYTLSSKSTIYLKVKCLIVYPKFITSIIICTITCVSIRWNAYLKQEFMIQKHLCQMLTIKLLPFLVREVIMRNAQSLDTNMHSSLLALFT